jgi:hypothetical protein
MFPAFSSLDFGDSIQSPAVQFYVHAGIKFKGVIRPKNLDAAFAPGGDTTGHYWFYERLTREEKQKLDQVFLGAFVQQVRQSQVNITSTEVLRHFVAMADRLILPDRDIKQKKMDRIREVVQHAIQDVMQASQEGETIDPVVFQSMQALANIFQEISLVDQIKLYFSKNDKRHIPHYILEKIDSLQIHELETLMREDGFRLTFTYDLDVWLTTAKINKIVQALSNRELKTRCIELLIERCQTADELKFLLDALELEGNTGFDKTTEANLACFPVEIFVDKLITFPRKEKGNGTIDKRLFNKINLYLDSLKSSGQPEDYFKAVYAGAILQSITQRVPLEITIKQPEEPPSTAQNAPSSEELQEMDELLECLREEDAALSPHSFETLTKRLALLTGKDPEQLILEARFAALSPLTPPIAISIPMT